MRLRLSDAYFQAPLRVGIIAGEHSGDILGAALVEQLKKVYPNLHCVGIAGEAMQKTGVESLYPMDRLSVMGFFEPLKRAKELLTLRHKLFKLFRDNPPHLFIGVDAPDFNLPLEKKLKACGIKTLHYVSPTVWAWRPNRIYGIKKAVDHMLLIFPFEKAIYEKHHIPATVIGHPLANTIVMHPDRNKACLDLGLDPSRPVLACLPGSRLGEVKRLSQDFVNTLKVLQKQRPDVQCVLAFANAKTQQCFQAQSHELSYVSYCGRTQAVLSAASAAMVTSGTATLETALHKVPHVVLYRVGWLTYQLAKRLIKTPYISMTNIVAQKRLVEEYIQKGIEPDKIAKKLLDLMDLNQQTTLQQAFCELHQSLEVDGTERAARAALQLIDPTS